MVSRRHLIIKFQETNILKSRSRKRADLRGEEVISRRTLGRRYLRWTRQRKFRAACITDGIDFTGAVVSEKEEQFVFQDRSAEAGAELLLLMDGLGVDSLRLVVGVQRVEAGISQM